jgi:hypothetical protein
MAEDEDTAKKAPEPPKTIEAQAAKPAERPTETRAS